MNKVYLMDCMEYMKGCKDNQFDLAIVDPPYGIGEDGSNNKSRCCKAESKDYTPFSGNDKKPPEKEYFTELLRISKNAIIWGAYHFIQQNHIGSSCWIVWDKVNGGTDFAGCELDKDYWQAQEDRFKNHIQQADLFGTDEYQELIYKDKT